MKHSTDANHSDIVRGLERFGVQVKDCSKVGSGFPDILTCYKNIVCLIEIKYGKDAQIKRTQMEFIANWKGYVGFAETFEEAINLAKTPSIYGLGQNQKDKIAVFLRTFKQKAMRFSTFKKDVLEISK